jgi:hypothetical protein
MSQVKSLSAGLFLCIFVLSSAAEAQYFGPIAVGCMSVLSLAASAISAVSGVPPNQLRPSAYAETQWVVRDYVAVEEQCFIGCQERVGIGSSDLPPNCYWADYTARVNGNYDALVNNVVVSESLQRFRVCGDTETGSKAAARSLFPPGSKTKMWYNRNYPEQHTFGEADPVLIGVAVGTGLFGVATAIVSIRWAFKIKSLNPASYTPLVQKV